jgi:predicted PurR-regulated permease PerM
MSGSAATFDKPAAPERDPGSTRPTSLTILATIAVVAALWAAQDVVIPIVLAALLSFALDPLHRRLVRWGVPRSLSAILLLTVVIGAGAVGAVSLRGQASAFVGRLPAVTQKFREALRNGRGAISTVKPVQQAANDLKKAAEETGLRPASDVTRVQLEEPAMRLSDLLWRGTMGAVELSVQATMVLFLGYYMLASGDQYKRKLLEIAGPSRFRKRLTLEILNAITEQVERFLVARVLITCVVGIATGIGLAAFGMPQPIIWGIVAGVLNNIPYVGPATVIGAATVTALVQFGTWEMAGAVCAVTTAIATVEGFGITPWIMGRASRMDTGVVFVSLVFWGWLWGIWGLLFAVPIMMSVKAVADNLPELGFVGELLRE